VYISDKSYTLMFKTGVSVSLVVVDSLLGRIIY
jgi:hypothetical protein